MVIFVTTGVQGGYLTQINKELENTILRTLHILIMQKGMGVCQINSSQNLTFKAWTALFHLVCPISYVK